MNSADEELARNGGNDGADNADNGFGSLVRSVREACGAVNSNVARQSADRVMGRFHGLQVRDQTMDANEEERGDLYEDEDFVAIVFEREIPAPSKGRGKRLAVSVENVVEYAQIERCLVQKSGRNGKKKVESVRMLHQDQDGWVIVKFMEEVLLRSGEQKRVGSGKKHKGRLAFTVPLSIKHGYKDYQVHTSAVLCTVTMLFADFPACYSDSEGNACHSDYHLLRVHDEENVLKLLEEHNAKLLAKSGPSKRQRTR
jgi:hypothetical protein